MWFWFICFQCLKQLPSRWCLTISENRSYLTHAARLCFFGHCRVPEWAQLAIVDYDMTFLPLYHQLVIILISKLRAIVFLCPCQPLILWNNPVSWPHQRTTAHCIDAQKSICDFVSYCCPALPICLGANILVRAFFCNVWLFYTIRLQIVRVCTTSKMAYFHFCYWREPQGKNFVLIDDEWGKCDDAWYPLDFRFTVQCWRVRVFWSFFVEWFGGEKTVCINSCTAQFFARKFGFILKRELNWPTVQ